MCCLILPEVTVLIATQMCIWFVRPFKDVFTGDVDKGDTVTDYMDQERDRGITITAAAISFFWNNHKINLIDTPGNFEWQTSLWSIKLVKYLAD